MNVLESPLEALALNYLSLGVLTVVNNLWTWVAVITAAFGFWRIRTTGGSTVSAAFLKSGDSPPPHRNDRSSSRSDPVPDVSSDEATAPVLPAPAPGVVVGEVEFDGGTKGAKFIAVYKEEDECSHELTAAVAAAAENEWDENGVADVVECGEWWPESWEKVLRMRTGEMGWYRYQDMTVLNGNVVRLWEDSRTRDVIRYSPRCLAW
ncbi:uncharacterized protein LOC121250959 [Juglans microcarpa x Juglans regia]|uniref:uncharacterized protein LOC121250959 n=1 Tax=Juglans microcarpa x Juglans regia TaxID=2249226 RepID=UPI001B7F298B|nr:uncharacterized protein LOC121250959 [Juglans microcarpa x Juglans regia]